jgi:hypothetical protein
MSGDHRSLVHFRSGARSDAAVTAESIERLTGVPVRLFAGVLDPATGNADYYLSVAVPVRDVERLVLGSAAVWSDAPLIACTYRSVSTIRADVARRIYGAAGRGIVWALIDSGVDGNHPHFKRHDNLTLPSPLAHLDLTGDSADATTQDRGGQPLTDLFGHGTYIAGIIAGENANVRVAEKSWDDYGNFVYKVLEVPQISGIAPECKVLSIKVLDDSGNGAISLVIQALAQVQQMNSGNLRVHGVNVGLDYETDYERFACGRSPLCLEAERLVRSGVVVVAAAGNTGYGSQNAMARPTQQGLEVSIHDPGNAELVLTVGSTDRELPHVYGVSYFSSKGPTVDGRPKPDLVAPGERIVSCAVGSRAAELRDVGLSSDVLYSPNSGTSVAAAHVSGAAAALLSARLDLIGDPGSVKAVLMNSALDLGRSPFYQGRGVIDLLQALQQNVSRPGQSQSPVSVATAAMSIPALAATAPSAPAAEKPLVRPLRVMYSYSHLDEVFKDELHTALAALRREGAIDVWQDRQILPGSEFDKDIAQALEASDIIILLVSKYFIASDYCWSVEMKQAVERHAQGTAAVLPVILKPADWKTSPFGKLTALPKDGKPIIEWQNPDAAWADVAEGMRRLVTTKRMGGPA